MGFFSTLLGIETTTGDMRAEEETCRGMSLAKKQAGE